MTSSLTTSVTRVQLGLLIESGWDIDAVEFEGSDVKHIAAYVAADRAFVEAFVAGIEPGPFVVVESVACVATQSTSGVTGKQDLVDVYQALGEVPEVMNWLAEALSTGCSVDELERCGATVVEHDDSRTVVEATCEGRRSWPLWLGGDASMHELERVMRITVRRAPWRDRAVRRLQVVESLVREAHLDPAAIARH